MAASVWNVKTVYEVRKICTLGNGQNRMGISPRVSQHGTFAITVNK